MKQILLKTDKLCKTFSTGGLQQHVLKNLDLEIYEGDFTVIMGASGSGKSTLLYSLSGMDQPTLGIVKYTRLGSGRSGDGGSSSGSTSSGSSSDGRPSTGGSSSGSTSADSSSDSGLSTGGSSDDDTSSHNSSGGSTGTGSQRDNSQAAAHSAGEDMTDITSLGVSEMAVFRRKNCGFVFQQIHLLDNMSVLDNVLVSGLLTIKDRKTAAERGKKLLGQVGITEADWDKFPAQLSGGEAQRVGIVRALMNEPRLVFADEPTGALNSKFSEQVLDAMTAINEQGQSLVVVTHDIKTARRANRVIYLKDGIICGECDLGAYKRNDRDRHGKLNAFLAEMGW